MKDKYWIARIALDELDDVHTIVISTNKHPECITIYGDKYEATERAIKVLKGLHDESK